jgi:8-oxo-dGTP diphosphatase
VKQLFENWRHYILEDMDSDQIRKIILINSDAQKYPNEWDFPGGHIHEDEDEIAGLKREVKEETTLDIASPVQVHQHGRIKFYKTRQYNGTIKLSEEHTEYKWVTIEELDSYTIGAKFIKAAKAAFKTDDDSETGNNL